MGMPRRWLVVLLAGALLLGSGTAGADPVDDRTRAAARELAESGVALFEKGDYDAALERFRKAEQLVPVPTIGLEVARTLAALGRRVEASEKYLAIGAMPIDPAAPPSYQAVQEEAKARARAELEELRPLLGRLEIVVEGSPDSVLLDGRPLPLAALGTPVPVDPGEHRIEVTRGSETRGETVVVAAGELGRVAIELPAATAAPPPPPAPDVVVAPAEEDAAFPLPVLGWAIFGVGAPLLVAGAVTGGLALELQSSLRERCPDDVCLESQAGAEAEDDIGRFETLRVASIATLIAGGALGTAGLVMALAAPDGTTEVALSPTGALVRGRF
jgi:hypothetical protein